MRDYKLFILLCIFMIVCALSLIKSYTKRTKEIYCSIDKPVVLYYKVQGVISYSVILKDANTNLIWLGSSSRFANRIAKKYNVGDTIKINIKNKICNSHVIKEKKMEEY